MGGREEELGTAANGGADAALMAAEVIHNDNVVRREDRHEDLLVL